MAKFKVGDRVQVVADNTPEGSGKHLVGLMGRVVDIEKPGNKYKYTVRTSTHRTIIASADELKLVGRIVPLPVAAAPESKVESANLGVPIGRLVLVDKDKGWPSRWQGTEGIVMSGADRHGGQQIKITKAGPRLGFVGVGAVYRLNNLTDISETWEPDLVPLPEFNRPNRKVAGEPITLGVGLERYTAGMPEGVEARHIMEIQGWYPAFCKGNILKYITRLDHKGQYLSDLNKIKTYAEELIRIEETKESK